MFSAPLGLKFPWSSGLLWPRVGPHTPELQPGGRSALEEGDAPGPGGKTPAHCVGSQPRWRMRCQDSGDWLRHVALAPAPASGIAGGFLGQATGRKGSQGGLGPSELALSAAIHFRAFLLPAEKAWELPGSQRLELRALKRDILPSRAAFPLVHFLQHQWPSWRWWGATGGFGG